MKIINMAVMANSGVSAVRAMLVGMVGMVLLGAGDHEFLFLLSVILFIAFRGGMSYRALHHLDYLGVQNGVEDVLVSGTKSGSGAYFR